MYEFELLFIVAREINGETEGCQSIVNQSRPEETWKLLTEKRNNGDGGQN